MGVAAGLLVTGIFKPLAEFPGNDVASVDILLREILCVVGPVVVRHSDFEVVEEGRCT